MFASPAVLEKILAKTSRHLRMKGFAVIDGPYSEAELERLSAAYDEAMDTAAPIDKRVSSSTRVWDVVSRIPVSQALYTYGPLLTACGTVVGEAFKLSATCLRTLEPGAPAQPLHVDVGYRGDGWPILGFILMIDDFTPENGATRFVPGSHRCLPVQGHTHGTGPEEQACASAGSIIVFDGSVIHGHSANLSDGRRRSIQGHFIPRTATVALDYRGRLGPDAVARIGEIGRYVLGLTGA